MGPGPGPGSGSRLKYRSNKQASDCVEIFFQIQIIAIWCIKYCFISSSKLETWEFYLKAKLFGGIVSVRIPEYQEVCHFSFQV